MRVCVYGSSSTHTPEAYLEAARELGTLLVQQDHLCINGAGANGVMGALNASIKAAGGNVRGVCHRMFVDGQITDLFSGLELEVTDGKDLHQRKLALSRDADCFIALPGGPGTWDELWEVACARQLGIGATAPVCLLNTDDYYAGFILQLQRAHIDRLLHKPVDEILHVASTPVAALEWCSQHVGSPLEAPHVVKARPQSVLTHLATSWGFSWRSFWMGWVCGIAITSLTCMPILYYAKTRKAT
mmetsp:Transcript_46630/g.77107  ORF Transcript_46630/g.77107 Transcript_46630/m.77107 type:complete len:244 (-) Transcript_46630:36-767(-)